MALKPNAGQFPQIARNRKGDPFVALRPGFDSQLKAPNGLNNYIARNLLFRVDETSIASTFAPFDPAQGGPDAVSKFEPWGEDEAPISDPTTSPGGRQAGASPQGGGSSITYRPHAIAARLAQGATPAVPRAAAISSSTPASAEQKPVEVAFGAHESAVTPSSGKSGSSVATRVENRNYSSLIAPARMDAERKCLAEAVYFESRSEPEAGQAAVAQVVLNRVASGLYPPSICGVVYQNRHRYKACQFSFACEGKSLRVTEQDSWSQAQRVANEVLDGRRWLSDVGFSTHYHANYVKPRWARRLTKMDVIGKHIFYKLKPGQT
jgi:spore germination cell wall hydrolase CwlJ-like protein